LIHFYKRFVMRLHCPTCYESISASESLRSLPCGHVFHSICVLKWFKSKKNCPQCRHPANEENARKIFLSEMDDDDTVNPDDLRNSLDNLQVQARLSNLEHENLKTKFKEIESNNIKLKEAIKIADAAKRKAEVATQDLKLETRYWKEERDRLQSFQTDAEKFKKQLERYTLLERALNESVGDVNMLLHERGCYNSESRDLATLVVELKKKLVDVKRLKAVSDRKVDDIAGQREDDRRKVRSFSVQIAEMTKHRENMEIDLKIALESNSRQREEVKRLEAKVAQLEKTISLVKEGGSGLSLIDWEDEKETEPADLSLSLMESPSVSFKSCAIMAGEKRKPLAEFRNEKRMKMETNLLEIGSRPLIGQAYDGLGGRSKPDIFPQPLQKRLIKKVVARKNSLLTKREKQKNTVDKFFGSFDTP